MTADVVMMRSPRGHAVVASTHEVSENRVRSSLLSPWLFTDFVSAVTANTVALGMVVCAFLGARATASPSTLLVFLNVAAAGIVVALAGNAVFLLSGLRHLRVVREAVLPARAQPAGASVAAAALDTPFGLLSGPALTRYHRPGCPAIAGKPVTPATREAHESAGRRPCGICAAPGAPVE